MLILFKIPSADDLTIRPSCDEMQCKFIIWPVLYALWQYELLDGWYFD